MDEHDLELARWRGGVDALIREMARRQDVLNGDVAAIKNTLGVMAVTLHDGEQARAQFLPLLQKMATAELVAEQVTARLRSGKELGLTRIQAWAGALGIALVFVNLVLRLAGVGAL